MTQDSLPARGRRSAPPRRKDWCPGALKPMETGDGLLVRVRASGGRLTLDQAAWIARGAIDCGNGAMSLSVRGNLQIRGATASTLPGLHGHLAAAGLLDADPEIERLRNIVVSPLSDIDTEAAFDLRFSVASLEARLGEDSTLRGLPAKFGFALDAGGRLPIADVEADIRFEAAREAAAPTFAVTLAGDESLAALCAEAEVGEVAARLSRAFLGNVGRTGGAPRRMRALVERIGAAVVFAEAGLHPALRPRALRHTAMGDALGVQTFGAKAAIGIAAPFGAVEAARFATLVDEAREAGAEGLRLTPWRAFFVVGVPRERTKALAEAAEKLGFILDATDPRLRVVACPGAPACAQARGRLQEDAERWARLTPKGAGVVLHLSGCAKGCARAQPTAVTLVATEEGYDFIAKGRAGDPPLHHGLSRSAVEAILASGEAFRKRPVA